MYKIKIYINELLQKLREQRYQSIIQKKKKKISLTSYRNNLFQNSKAQLIHLRAANICMNTLNKFV